MEEAESLLRRSVKIAVEAREKFWSSAKRRTGHNYNKALVAASIGSYGAYLADGSEYRLVTDFSSAFKIASTK